MNIEQRKEYLSEEIRKIYSNDPVVIVFSSPAIKRFRISSGINRSYTPVPESAAAVYEDKPDTAVPDTGSAALSRKDKRALRRMKRDLEKRGFSVDVFRLLSDPADIYDMSDDELMQIEVAGVINEDGYYSFVYPPDFSMAKETKENRSTVVFIGSFCLVLVILLVTLINNISSLF